ncbi:hypothetical protein BDEG_27501 [Batrachochytrium dendrobatidis JEL423]|uniref:Uncharacterized protein n=1 Tax=Batrachochytrium dendrobatidis (strain JEL423) TaxID=403673 RepID=A0A177WW05_BATDL|nr:hypothetical protein BDEG_27501 [Batrachochytrium dendrobatidis JEL423]
MADTQSISDRLPNQIDQTTGTDPLIKYNSDMPGQTLTIIQDDFNNIWRGTQMRICIMDLTYSAAELKPDNMLIFTDFNYLKPSDILTLLSMWLKVDMSENADIQEVSSRSSKTRYIIFTQIDQLD